MVQVMESWFLADHEKLESFYAKDFQASALPKSKNVETIDKHVVLKALKHASRNTIKGEYHKIWHASELLKLIRPCKVREASVHCEYLFQTLESKILAVS